LYVRRRQSCPCYNSEIHQSMHPTAAAAVGLRHLMSARLSTLSVLKLELKHYKRHDENCNFHSKFVLHGSSVVVQLRCSGYDSEKCQLQELLKSDHCLRRYCVLSGVIFYFEPPCRVSDVTGCKMFTHLCRLVTTEIWQSVGSL